MPSPDYCQYLGELWGWPDEFTYGGFADASNIVIGTNPPYTTADFLSIYPNFGGASANITGTLANGSAIVTAVSSVSGLAPGQLIIGTGIPGGATIAAVNAIAPFSLTLSLPATQDGTISLTVYTAPFVPLAVINLYINLASACLVQARWLDQWYMAMALYIAHFSTLYLVSQGNPATTAGQVAAAGALKGMQVSKAVGDVSVGYQNLMTDYASWGAWNMTSYGALFETFARSIGSGPMLVW